MLYLITSAGCSFSGCVVFWGRSRADRCTRKSRLRAFWIIHHDRSIWFCPIWLLEGGGDMMRFWWCQQLSGCCWLFFRPWRGGEAQQGVWFVLWCEQSAPIWRAWAWPLHTPVWNFQWLGMMLSILSWPCSFVLWKHKGLGVRLFSCHPLKTMSPNALIQLSVWSQQVKLQPSRACFLFGFMSIVFLLFFFLSMWKTVCKYNTPTAFVGPQSAVRTKLYSVVFSRKNCLFPTDSLVWIPDRNKVSLNIRLWKKNIFSVNLEMIYQA